MQRFAIRQACIFLGMKCNLSCKYCYNKNKPNYNRSITKKKITQIISFLSQHSDKELWISFSGGEPFVYPRLIQHAITEFEKINTPIHYNVTTNGTILNKKLLETLINAHAYFCVSLDGDKQTQNKSRCDSYEKTIEFIQYLQNKNYDRLRIRMTIQPDDSDKLIKNINHLTQQGIKEVHFAPNYETNWTDTQLHSFFKQLKQISSQNTIIEPINKFSQFNKPFKYKKGPYEHECGLFLTFTPDGNIYPCPRLVFEDTCLISKKLSITQVLLGIADWSELLQNTRHKIGSNFFCPANNLKIQKDIFKPLPLFKKFEKENDKLFNSKA